MGAANESALAALRAVARDPGRVAREARARGLKVVGTRCMFVPDEIVWAAGLLPYPLYGTPEPIGPADSYFQSCTCEFVRNVFDHALAGRLEFLDGLALANTCDVMRRMVDLWRKYIPRVPVSLLVNPQKLMNEGNRAYYLAELQRFRTEMEALSGERATDERLQAAIALYNRTRDLLRELYSLRRAEHPALTGAEALDVCQAVSCLPRDQANPLLERLIAELQARPVEKRHGPRVLVTGSILDHPALLAMIEEEGGQVVIDDLCTTTRTFWHRMEPDDDPLLALWRHHNRRPLCACMHPTEARLDYLGELIEAYRVQAVIYFNLKYCHPFLYEAPLTKAALARRGIPTSVLEVGHDLSGHGQLRTRIQAFLEMLDD